MSAKRIAALEGHVATLRGIISKAEALAEQQRQEVATATKRADYLVAGLFEATSKLVEMSKREQGASNRRSEGLKSPEVREYSVSDGSRWSCEGLRW